MLFVRENKDSSVVIQKKAPKVGSPYKEAEKKEPVRFYKNDLAMSGIIEGYSVGTGNSYEERLVEKYPLCGE